MAIGPKNTAHNILPANDVSQSNTEVFNFEDWVAHQLRITNYSLDQFSPDTQLFDRFDPQDLLTNAVLPLQYSGNRSIILISDIAPDSAKKMVQEMLFNPIFITVPHGAIMEKLAILTKAPLLKKARDYCPEAKSARTMTPTITLLSIQSVVITLFVMAQIFSISFVHSLLLFCIIFTVGNSILRFIALFQPREKTKPNPIGPIVPVPVSILVPLFKEERVLAQIIRNLIDMDYPKSQLDIKLLLEETDKITTKAIKKIELPPHFEVIIVPEDTLQTKPKAMNFALPSCKGKIIGIYDAEDHPETDQIMKVVDAFTRAPQKMACMQCELDFHNQNSNWFSRCFTIEYRIWFAALLPIVQKLGMAVPLGGTSVFIRSEVLKEVGGWDAYNVTEDADLGIRLKRAGYLTGVVKSKTWEEANTRGISWIKQRSRWLKGYMVTWLVHMRNPLALWRELGPLGFAGVQIMFLGAIIGAFALPIYLLMWGSMFGYDILGFAAAPLWLKMTAIIGLSFSQVANLAITFKTLISSKRTKPLFKWYFTMPFYWPLGTLAVYKALFELIFKPFYWDKTEHGIYKTRRRWKLPFRVGGF